jgi:hypothetical protein
MFVERMAGENHAVPEKSEYLVDNGIAPFQRVDLSSLLCSPQDLSQCAR